MRMYVPYVFGGELRMPLGSGVGFGACKIMGLGGASMQKSLYRHCKVSVKSRGRRQWWQACVQHNIATPLDSLASPAHIKNRPGAGRSAVFGGPRGVPAAFVFFGLGCSMRVTPFGKFFGSGTRKITPRCRVVQFASAFLPVPASLIRSHANRQARDPPFRCRACDWVPARLRRGHVPPSQRSA